MLEQIKLCQKTLNVTGHVKAKCNKLNENRPFSIGWKLNYVEMEKIACHFYINPWYWFFLLPLDDNTLKLVQISKCLAETWAITLHLPWMFEKRWSVSFSPLLKRQKTRNLMHQLTTEHDLFADVFPLLGPVKWSGEIPIVIGARCLTWPSFKYTGRIIVVSLIWIFSQLREKNGEKIPIYVLQTVQIFSIINFKVVRFRMRSKLSLIHYRYKLLI